MTIGPENYRDNYENEDLAKIYSALVGNWDLRWGAESPFLTKILSDVRSEVEKNDKDGIIQVLETAMGTGLEAVNLSRGGLCKVFGNELDPYLHEIAKKNISKEGVDITTSSFRWRELEKHLPSNFFDILLCIGNSFSYLADKDSQIKALKSFYTLMKKGGKIIIDIRNWEPMIEPVKSLLDSGKDVSDESCPISMDPMYNGASVKGFPLEIDEKSIIYEYFNVETGDTARLTMSMLLNEDMMELFNEVGFESAKVYSDFKEGLDHNSHYRQYVLTK